MNLHSPLRIQHDDSNVDGVLVLAGGYGCDVTWQ